MVYKDIRRFRVFVTGVWRCPFPFTVSLCQNRISQLQLYLAWCTASNATFSFTIALSEITIRVLLAPMKSISAIFGISFKIRIFFYLLFFHDHFHFSFNLFGFWDVFDVSCIIILGNWFAKFLLVMVYLNDIFKGEFTDG